MEQLVVNQTACIGCGSCEVICPKVFKMKEMKAVVVDKQGDSVENIQMAIDSCPGQAISWQEDN